MLIADRFDVGEARARQRHVARRRSATAAGCSSWPTRRRTGGSGARPRSCPHRRRTPVPSRGPASTARRSTAGAGSPPCERRLRHPWRATSGVTRSSRFAGRRIDGDRGAARVVAVEAEPGVHVELGAAHGPRTTPPFGLTRPAVPCRRCAGRSRRRRSDTRRRARRRACAATASTRSRSARSRAPLVCSTSSSRTVSSRVRGRGVVQPDRRDVVVAHLQRRRCSASMRPPQRCQPTVASRFAPADERGGRPARTGRR